MRKLFCFPLVVAVLAGCPKPKGDPAKSETRLALARDFLGRGELEAAETEANRALGFLPTNEEAYNVRGLVHLLRAKGAHNLVEVEGCLTGIDAEALRSEKDQELELARRDFARAAQLAPDYGEAWSNAGTAAFLLEDYAAAREAFDTALGNPARLMSPGLTRANLGWVFFMEGNHVAAAKELRQAIQFQPGMCVATYRLGRVYFAREEWENAADKFQEVSDQPECRSQEVFAQEAALYLMKARLEQGLIDDAKAAQAACIARVSKSCLAAQCRGAAMDAGGAR